MTREEAIEVYNGLINTKIKEAFEFFAPELKESEGERIRKEMVKHFEDTLESRQGVTTSEQVKSWLAWLEKQKEQNPEWSEEDEENFKWFDKFFRAESVIAGGRDIPQDKYLWFKSIRPQPKQEWSEKDKKLIDDVINSLCCYQNTLSDYQKEIVGEEIRKLKSLKPQPKPEWDEKDEKMRDRLIDRLQFITLNTRTDTTSPNITFFDEIAWLKSLRPQSHWKPTEEQMKAIESCFCEFGEGCPDEDELRSLYNDLKKLM